MIETRGKQADPKCLLFDHSRILLAKNDDGGIERNCKIQHNLGKGKYIIQIQAATDSSHTTGKFKIKITRQN